MAGEHIVGLRPVHEIVVAGFKGPDGLPRKTFVAFVQHGNFEEGYEYEGVCVWCGLTTGKFQETSPDGGPPLEFSLQEVTAKLVELTKVHVLKCTAGRHRMAVQKTKIPLNTEIRKKEH